MEKITFEKLHRLVANIDYLYDDSYPICFDVTTDGVKREFECGITTPFEYDGNYFDEYQYLGIIKKYTNHKLFINLQMDDADDMDFNEIGEMLTSYCNIKENSVIRLLGKSFKGKRRKIYSEDDLSLNFITDYNVSKFEDDLTEEVSKGIEWFKNILGKKDVLVSTKEGSFVDLNNMNGSTFSFIFDRKVLYYNTMTSAICTYCPTVAIKTKNYHPYIRLESNDKFKWLLLYICNGEDLLSSTKVCYIEIEDEFKVKKTIEGINNEKVNNFFNTILENALASVR